MIPYPRAGSLRFGVRSFETRPDFRPPTRGEVAVWLLEPDFGERDFVNIGKSLSGPERERLAGIQHPRARAEFLAGRRLIRTVLGALCDLSPEKVSLVESARGALSLGGEYDKNWKFNLSHTEGLVALAVAHSEVGIDVEWLDRPGRTVELADRYFAPAETAALRALPSSLQRPRFFDLWTLKESYIKARGLGLQIPLRAFAFRDLETEIHIEVDADTADSLDERWRFALVDLGSSHRMALALRT